MIRRFFRERDKFFWIVFAYQNNLYAQGPYDSRREALSYVNPGEHFTVVALDTDEDELVSQAISDLDNLGKINLKVAKL